MNPLTKFFLSVAQAITIALLIWHAKATHDLQLAVAVLNEHRCHCPTYAHQ